MAKKARSKTERAADAEIGERLAAIRKQRGVTQVELAEALGTIQTVVSDYEVGRLRPSATMLRKLAVALKVSADEILGLAPPPRGSALNPRLLRRLQAIEALPKRDQEALLRTIDTFLERDRARHPSAS